MSLTRRTRLKTFSVSTFSCVKLSHIFVFSPPFLSPKPLFSSLSSLFCSFLFLNHHSSSFFGFSPSKTATVAAIASSVAVHDQLAAVAASISFVRLGLEAGGGLVCLPCSRLFFHPTKCAAALRRLPAVPRPDYESRFPAKFTGSVPYRDYQENPSTFSPPVFFTSLLTSSRVFS